MDLQINNIHWDTFHHEVGWGYLYGFYGKEFLDLIDGIFIIAF